MPAPVYPTILTKTDWDANKGTIGKHPTELGIKARVEAAWNEWRQIDWSLVQQCTVIMLKDLPRPQIIHLIARIQQAAPRIAATRTALSNLADTCRDVVMRYERAVTFAKPTIEHVRKMQRAATDFSAELQENGLQRELLMARKAKGYARVRDLDLNAFLDEPPLSKLFLPAARKGFCEESWQFLMETRCSTKGRLPEPARVPNIYRDFIENNDANIAAPLQQTLIKLQKDGQLADPPAEGREAARRAWEAAHKECQKMFPSRYAEWKNSLAIEGNDDRLLDPALQA